MPDKRTIRIEVAYAGPGRQYTEELMVAAGSTAREVIQLSTLRQRFPEIDLRSNRIGIYGRLTGLDTIVEDGERVEIYRPLKADPKTVRRQLAQQGKTMGRPGRTK